MAVTRYLLKILAVMLILAAVNLPSPIAKGDEAHGFPLVRGLRHVCGGHIGNKQGRWDAFATTASVTEIVAQYRRKLGEAGMEGDEHEGAMWRLPVGATKPKRLLEVLASTKDERWRDCDSALLAKAKCIVVASEIVAAN